ncbi:Uma2 family endonuclease [Armatimonas sp.]|uniref:Uma2 family endonuclease n=1 Tax=Armatimonas sp. TaxID=1872638 RepID=UPI003753A739
MSTVVAVPSISEAGRTFRLTRAHVAVLLEAGLVEQARYELLNGVLVEKLPQNKPHVVSCRRTTHALEDRFGRDRVGAQAPIVLDDLNEPEPDVFVTRLPLEDYSDNPPACEVLLVVEVADATLRTDRTDKAESYARAGIPEYWVVDVKGRRLIVHRQPSDDGYGSVQTLLENVSVVALAAESQLMIQDLLP